jgi:hypothetical protein
MDNHYFVRPPLKVGPQSYTKLCAQCSRPQFDPIHRVTTKLHPSALTKQASPPQIIAAIRMYRDVRGISFPQAVKVAIEEYDKRGWIVPESIRSVHNLHKERREV